MSGVYDCSTDPEQQQDPHRPASRWIVTSSLLAIALAIFTVAGQPARAQSLNDEVVRLLNNNCDLLGFNGSTGVQEFGPNLFKLCDIPETSGAGSGGGGAASPQAATLSLQNSLVDERLDRVRKEKKGEEGDTSSALDGYRQSPRNAQVYAAGASDDTGSSASLARSRRFDLFVSVAGGSLDRNTTTLEAGYDSSIVLASVGFDYRFNNTVLAGLALAYRKQDGDFVGGGDLSTTAIEPVIFVSVLPSRRTFLQFVVGFGQEDTDVDRNVTVQFDQADRGVTGPAASAVDSTLYSGRALFGYDASAGRFTFGPRVAFNLRNIDIDPYVERGMTGVELRVAERSVESRQATLGFYASAAVSTKSAVLLPQVNIEYVREFEDDPIPVTAQFVEDLRGTDAVSFRYLTNAPDSNFVNFDLGLSAVLRGGIQPYVNFRVLLGSDLFDSVVGTLGVRFEL